MATIRIPNFSADDVPPDIADLSISDFDVDEISDDEVDFENEDDNVRLVIEGDFDFDSEIIEDPGDARNVIQNTEGDLELMRISNLDEDITLLALVDADANFDDIRSLMLDGDLDQAMTLAAALSTGPSVIDGSEVPVGFELDLSPGADNEINGVPLGIAEEAVIDDAIGSGQDDTIGGNSAANTLRGGAGDDTLLGRGGEDILEGGAGNDTLSGGLQKDQLTGGAGDDVLNGNDSDDTIAGGADDDIISGGNGNDTIDGGADADRLNGGNSGDTLSGGAGDDRLQGGKGSDELDGGNGGDTLLGGAGSDTLTGGAGDDTFVYTDAEQGVDTITDFADGDAIDLAAVLNFTPDDDINAFVAIDGETLQVDPDGGGSFTDLVTVAGGFGGASIEALVADGSVVVS